MSSLFEYLKQFPSKSCSSYTHYCVNNNVNNRTVYRLVTEICRLKQAQEQACSKVQEWIVRLEKEDRSWQMSPRIKNLHMGCVATKGVESRKSSFWDLANWNESMSKNDPRTMGVFFFRFFHKIHYLVYNVSITKILYCRAYTVVLEIL